ncbi:unnamed protein product [Gongylonema pulchrum]|uniref:Beta/gamma crystallin 'Greek key' domain-containing protein n=1 Tax=Gongylonema pulchrum TaxID=637853 RepID=A0A183CVG2_9BILA|nr:unnamed protein product [Gongylonema pulchrum]
MLIDRPFADGTTVLRFKNFTSAKGILWESGDRCQDTENYVSVAGNFFS